MQNQITDKVLLLNNKGHLTHKGYATKMNFIYNKENVKSFPLKLKEWNFYQFIKDKYSLQLTIGHVSYACSINATLINLETGNRHEIGAFKLFKTPSLDDNPEDYSYNEYKDENLFMSFEVTEGKRILYVKGKNEKYKDVEIRLDIENDINNEKMVIATPFKKKTQFYLNYKENYYNVIGFARFDDFEVSFDNATGLIDWGRGVWPFSHQWFWGNLTSFINNVPFGFNIGWGFGDLSNATENMFFYNKKAYKLGELIVNRNPNNYMDPWHLKDKEGNIELHFTPIYDNYTFNKVLFVNTHCDQVYGYFKGFIKVDGKKIEFDNILAFIEHAVNKW